MENVLAINFTEDAEAYEALTTLKELDGQGQVALEGAAVVVRQEDGTITIKDEVGDIGYEGTATGGIVGLIVGILGGPIGVLLGGATGVLIGSLFDLDDLDETDSVLSKMSRTVRVGHPSVVAEVDEQVPRSSTPPSAGWTARSSDCRSLTSRRRSPPLRKRSAPRRRRPARSCTRSGARSARRRSRQRSRSSSRSSTAAGRSRRTGARRRVT